MLSAKVMINLKETVRSELQSSSITPFLCHFCHNMAIVVAGISPQRYIIIARNIFLMAKIILLKKKDLHLYIILTKPYKLVLCYHKTI